MSLMFANIFGVRHDLVFASFLGIACLLFAVVVLAENARAVWKETPARGTNLVIAILVGYSLLFSLGTAAGRVCLGIEAARPSGYVTLLIPGLLGIYFHLLSRPDGNRRRVLFAVFFFLLLPGSVQGYTGEMRYYAERKRWWKDCYMKNENVEFCNQVTRFKLYWWPEGMRLQEKLQYLKENRLNLYADAKDVSIQTASTLASGNRFPLGFVDLAIDANVMHPANLDTQGLGF